jgi:N-methylhydantoinase A
MNSDSKQPGELGYALAVDVGGTFVDITLCELATGQRWVRKVLSDRGPQRAFIDGVGEVCDQADVPLGKISRVVHGMTLATNAILEQSNSGAAAVVTAGFRDVLELGRHDAPRGVNNHGWIKPRRPVTRDHILEVEERVDWAGNVLVPLTDDALEGTLKRLCELKPVSVAVCLLHADRYPDHEERVVEYIRAEMPDVFVSASHEVLPQAGEFERLMATVLNAYTMPAVTSYVAALEAELTELGVRAPLYIMSSDGGVLGSQDARRFPIHTALSGPAGGAAGAARFAADLGRPRILTLDVGGTSSDVAATENGAVEVSVSASIGAFPLAIPVLDVHTVGAGGGSLARVEDGRLSVGPRSAGARPGPVCYGRGGTQPTVTDALLVLGWLPETLAGGAMTVSRAAANEAIDTQVAKPLGLDAVTAAAGIVTLANAHMAAAIRHMSTERGRDPRDYALVPFGGAGGLHAAEVARDVGIPEVIVPPSPGVFTTEGLLAADLSRHYVHSYPRPQRLGEIDAAQLDVAFGELESAARTWLAAGARAEEHRTTRLLDMRYVNQSYELIVELPSGLTVQAALERAVAEFHASYQIRYRYSLPDVPIEVVRLRVAAGGLLPHAARTRPPTGAAPQLGASSRDVYFDTTGWRSTPVLDRYQMSPGDRVAGPAVVQEYDSTTVIPPNATATVTVNGSLLITFDEGEGNS